MTTITTDAQQQLRDQGYVLAPILSDDELAHYRDVVAPIYAQAHEQKLAGDLEGTLKIDVYDPAGEIYKLSYHPKLMALAEELMSPNIVLDNATVRMTGEGATYKQGWHRDTVQVPIEQVDERWFAPGVFFNCLQINLPLFDDESFWCVPASHNRSATPGEQACFIEGKHLTDPEADMPGGAPLPIKAGWAALYNNNLIHRGYNAKGAKRVTFHASYHSDSAPPTWHFFVGRFRQLSEDDIAKFSPEFQTFWRRNRAVAEQYPDVTATYACPA